jgi:hypothetical protein
MSSIENLFLSHELEASNRHMQIYTEDYVIDADVLLTHTTAFNYLEASSGW